MSSKINGFMGKLLGKAEILEAEDLATEPVEVPEWGGWVNVKGLSGVERDAWEESRVDRRAKVKAGEARPLNLVNFRASLVAQCVVDEGGKRLFSDKEAIDLGRKSAVAINRVFEVAQRLCGMTDEDMDELTGDLEPEDSVASPSS